MPERKKKNGETQQGYVREQNEAWLRYKHIEKTKTHYIYIYPTDRKTKRENLIKKEVKVLFSERPKGL